jgi:hypothetical protein
LAGIFTSFSKSFNNFSAHCENVWVNFRQLLSDDEDDIEDLGFELNTHLDVLDSKSSVLRRASLASLKSVTSLKSVAVAAAAAPVNAFKKLSASSTPEKHELEQVSIY